MPVSGRLAVSVSGHQLDLYVDCQHVHSRVIHPPDRNVSSEHPLQLWLGQRNAKHFRFQVSTSTSMSRPCSTLCRIPSYVLRFLCRLCRTCPWKRCLCRLCVCLCLCMFVPMSPSPCSLRYIPSAFQVTAAPHQASISCHIRS